LEVGGFLMAWKRKVEDVIADFEDDTNKDNNSWVTDIKLLIEHIRELENDAADLENQLIEATDAKFEYDWGKLD
jgi:hypothetical protein